VQTTKSIFSTTEEGRCGDGIGVDDDKFGGVGGLEDIKID
jgi:hypothetical protein